MKKAELKAEMQITADRFASEGAYGKHSMMVLAQRLAAPIMALQNIGIRRIVDLDNIAKVYNNEATLAVQANRAWNRGGSEDLFGTSLDTKDEFINRYSALQRGYIEALEMPEEAQNKALEALWEGVTHTGRLSVINDVKQANTLGLEATMQQAVDNTATGAALANFRKNLSNNPVGRFAFTAVFPFTRTPINALTEVLDHSPMALTTKRFRDMITKGTPEEQLDAFSRVVAGTSLMSTVFYAIHAGTLTGGSDLLTLTGTIAPTEREEAKAEGRIEHSILIGDTWYSYEKLGPLASLISSAADVARLHMTDDKATMANLMAQSFAIAADDSHLRTLGEVLEIIRNPNTLDELTNFSIRQGSKVITPLSAAQNSMRDLLVNKKYRSTMENELGNLNGELRKVITNGLKTNTMFIVGLDAIGGGIYEQDIDVAGNDIRSYSDTLAGKFLHLIGVGNRDHTQEPYVQELVDLGLLPNNTNSNHIHGVPMNSTEFKEHSKAMYHGNADAAAGLNKLVTSEDYRNILNDTARKDVLRQALEVYKNYQKSITFSKNTRLQNEAYVRELFKLTQAYAPATKLETTTADKAKASARRKVALDSKNKVNLRTFKDHYNIDSKRGTTEDPFLKEKTNE
jgi:hypothetical protein